MANLEDDPAYLRARVGELERAVADLRSRLIALARVLPPDYVPLLDRNAAAVEADAPGWSVFEGWDDTIAMKTSRVAPEMNRLWARLGPAAGSGRP